MSVWGEEIGPHVGVLVVELHGEMMMSECDDDDDDDCDDYCGHDDAGVLPFVIPSSAILRPTTKKVK